MVVQREIRYALRTIRHNPGFAFTAILTLALAIGGNTAMFTVVHAVLLKPLAYPNPEQLLRITGGASPTRFDEIKNGAHSFTGVGAFANEESLTLTGAFEPEVLTAARVSANFLSILGVNPLHGRAFLPEEDIPGAAPVALISAELWQRRFSANTEILNKTAALGGTSYTIAGVLPPHFDFPFPGVDVWITQPAEWPLMQKQSRALSPFLTVFGRLKPGVTLPQANAELSVLHHQYALAHPAMLDAKIKSPIEATRLKEQLVADVNTMLWLLFGAVCFVLLIACANIANLLLARASSRQREFAVRAALGASRARLASQLLTESLLLSCAGGALGLALAALALRAIPALTSLNLPRLAEIHLDGDVLFFAAAISLLTGLLFGLTPSLQASRPDLVNALRARGAATSAHGFNLRNLLVVAQVALSIMLLVGAALLLESLVRLRNVDIGFDPSNLLTLRISLPTTGYDTLQKRADFFAQSVEQVRSIPGVRAATAAMFFPMTGFVGGPVQDAAKPPLKLNERPIITILMVAPDYFQTLRIPLRAGRDFNPRDKVGAQRVAIIDESFARRFWPRYPSENPVGKLVLVGGVNLQPVEIIGVAANSHQDLANTAWPETIYIAFAQNAQPSAMLAIRTDSNPSALTSAIREKMHALDRNQAIASVHTMDDLIDQEVGQRRVTMTLLAAFASLAVILAVVGIYGLIAYTVVQRTQEIGIRRALGAQDVNVMRLVVGRTLGLVTLGVALGTAGAFGLSHFMTHLVFQVSPTDPTIFVSIALLFLLVAIAASYLPAMRATHIDPLTALKVE